MVVMENVGQQKLRQIVDYCQNIDRLWIHTMNICIWCMLKKNKEESSYQLLVVLIWLNAPVEKWTEFVYCASATFRNLHFIATCDLIRCFLFWLWELFSFFFMLVIATAKEMIFLCCLSICLHPILVNSIPYEHLVGYHSDLEIWHKCSLCQ